MVGNSVRASVLIGLCVSLVACGQGGAWLGEPGDRVDRALPVWTDARGTYTCDVVGTSFPPTCLAAADSDHFVRISGLDASDFPQAPANSNNSPAPRLFADLHIVGTMSADGRALNVISVKH